MSSRKYGVWFVVASVLCLVVFWTIPLQSSDFSGQKECELIYIDLGTNVGVQIRKLYEPELYPKAKIAPYFEKYFGSRRADVCSFGFEPNPAHALTLRRLVKAYNRMGWRVKIFENAVGSSKGKLPFLRQEEDTKNREWGARLAKKGETSNVLVDVIDVNEWFSREVLGRHSKALPTIVMKVDIEGGDMALLSSLVYRGFYCVFSFIYAEHVDQTFLNSTAILQQKYQQCQTKLLKLDDETYHGSDFPLPA